MGICKICNKESKYISSFLSLCKDCIKSGKGKEIIREAHKKSREIFCLPSKIPKSKNGIKCYICGNECKNWK